VSRERVEVAAERAHVDAAVRHGLRPVDEHGDLARVGEPDDALDRVDRAEGVRDVADGDELRPLREQGLEGVHLQLAAVVDRRDAQGRAGLLAEHLPGHDVGVVLEVGDQHLVARAHALPPEGPGHQVDGLGGVADEDRLAGVRADEVRGLAARALDGLRRAQRQLVDAAVHVGVVARVHVRDGVDHGLGLLGAGRAVQADQRPAVHRLGQDGEVLARSFGIEAHDVPPRA
jgi:hypothetical protein